jgi:hypothetical protein
MMNRPLLPAQAAGLAGVTLRVVQAWDQGGLLHPGRRKRGQQSIRIYDEQQLLALMVLAELRARGLARSKALRRAAAAMLPGLGSAEYILFDGRAFYRRESAESACALAAVLGGPVWLIAMKDKRRRVSLAARGDYGAAAAG